MHEVNNSVGPESPLFFLALQEILSSGPERIEAFREKVTRLRGGTRNKSYVLNILNSQGFMTAEIPNEPDSSPESVGEDTPEAVAAAEQDLPVETGQPVEVNFERITVKRRVDVVTPALEEALCHIMDSYMTESRDPNDYTSPLAHRISIGENEYIVLVNLRETHAERTYNWSWYVNDMQAKFATELLHGNKGVYCMMSEPHSTRSVWLRVLQMKSDQNPGQVRPRTLIKNTFTTGVKAEGRGYYYFVGKPDGKLIPVEYEEAQKFLRERADLTRSLAGGDKYDTDAFWGTGTEA